jgi:hypothetical protein
MPRRIGRRRPAVAGVTAAPVLGIAPIAFLPAAAGRPAIPAAALPYLAVLGYLVNLVILVVFGIWGFRIGTGWRDDGNGGGSKGPDVEPPPAPGGRELTDDFPAWEEQFGAPEHEPTAADRLDKISAGRRDGG